ncbi:MAG: pyridoxal phosphate-dependent aminotransferase [Alphaproteobacteria bacterium]
MRFSSMVQRVGGMGADAWAIHSRTVERLRRGEPVIMLSVGEDQGARTPDAIVAAGKAALDQGFHHYSPLTGSPELREAVAARHRALTGQSLGPDDVAVLAGAQNALFTTFLCLTDPGDEVIVPDPFYATYPGVVQANGAKMVRVACDPERAFVVDPADIAAAVTPRTRAILLNSPNNPTGAVYPAEVMEAVARICIDHDLWLVSDEVYADFIYEGSHVAPCVLPGMAERTVTIGSLSKSHRMSGWRVGWIAANRELCDLVSDLACCMLYGLPGFIQKAALAALDPTSNEIESDRQAMLADYRARRDLVCGRLADTPGIIVRVPAAGMFAMVDVRPSGLDDFTFASRLLDEEDVGVMTGAAFGDSAVGHIRLGLVASQDTLADACERIDRFCRRLVG